MGTLRAPPAGFLRPCSRRVAPPRGDHTLSHVTVACGLSCGGEGRCLGLGAEGLGLGSHGLLG
eukprot:177944-Alexandrium_andersonii.AAC.1